MPQLKASCAILDPPWYPDYTLLFLTAAAEACAQGATILLCQPTDASRPGVQREQTMLLGTLPDPGLELTGHHRHWLRYETPHFERMSLRKLLPATRIPRDWRVGDLLALRKVAPRRLPGRPSVHVERWEEVRFGPVRIKLRPSQSAFEIEPLVPGDILDTVSRRDQIRQRIGMWTSGNRVYGIMNPRLVGTLINCCQNDWRLQRFSLDQIIAHADGIGVDAATAARLFTALKVELSEHG